MRAESPSLLALWWRRRDNRAVVMIANRQLNVLNVAITVNYG